MIYFSQILNQINAYLWGLPLIGLLVLTGLWLTWCLRGLQISKLPHALYLAFIQRQEPSSKAVGDISHFQALMTALSATVGTGNIAGVATAIAVGGPGALFWMWVTGLVGMATKYAEAVLAVKYRRQAADGSMSGGPMYYIKDGLGLSWLATLFALFAAIAAFGIGNMVQANSVAQAVQTAWHLPLWMTGVVAMAFVAVVILGGIQSIARVASCIVPFMIVIYMLACLLVVALSWRQVPHVLVLVFEHAFNGTAATGGFLGASIMLAMRMGVARGIFSNESGLGSAPIAAAAAKCDHPVSQALVSMTQTFIDTLIVCSLTGFVILVSGVWTTGLNGAALTMAAFDAVLPGSDLIVTLDLILFAFTTILGWSYYGEKAFTYLFGDRCCFIYRLLFVMAVLVGALLHLDVVWSLADMFNALMAFPNLVALLLLSPVVVRETRQFFDYYQSSE